MPKISVIIPVYNKEKYIAKTIESVLNQSFTDFELIILDDGSTDKSLSIIKQFTDARIKLIEQENIGVSATRNKGVSLSQAELIAFLDADDLWYPKHLVTINDLYLNFTNADFFATAYEVKYNDVLTTKFIHNFDKEQVLIERYYQYTKGVLLFFTSNFAIKKSVFEQSGGFKDIHSEDVEFFLRIGIQHKMAYSKLLTMTHLDQSDNSLYATHTTDKKVLLLNNFREQEQTDSALKMYLDNIRYAWVVEYLLSDEKEKAKKLIKEINIENLNDKQRFLINRSYKQLLFLKKIQNFLKRNSIRISAFTN
jgi:glycosyltransferase involved in cell wall biosynthesis